MSLHLLHHTHQPHFTPIDPLGDGLREDILAEQAEPEHIDFDEGFEEGSLGSYLESITADIKEDPDEFTFSED
jgi:hypothetical protein